VKVKIIFLFQLIYKTFTIIIGGGRIWASIAGNGEISEWNMETGERVRALWPCADIAAPLTYQQVCLFVCKLNTLMG
jgi:hypothetical protein